MIHLTNLFEHQEDSIHLTRLMSPMNIYQENILTHPNFHIKNLLKFLNKYIIFYIFQFYLKISSQATSISSIFTNF